MVTQRGYCWNSGWRTVELLLIASTDPQLQRLLTRRAFRSFRQFHYFGLWRSSFRMGPQFLHISFGMFTANYFLLCVLRHFDQDRGRLSGGGANSEIGPRQN